MSGEIFPKATPNEVREFKLCSAKKTIIYFITNAEVSKMDLAVELGVSLRDLRCITDTSPQRRIASILTRPGVIILHIEVPTINTTTICSLLMSSYSLYKPSFSTTEF
jgi:hypothetical protein